MRRLLDTHTLLWALNDDKRPGPTVRDLISNHANDVMVSIASLWKLAIKSQIGKLKADIQGMSDAINRSGVALLDINIAHLAALTGLPRHHKDPFDHLLIAQAIAEQATLTSEDRWMASYPVPVVSCSA